MLSRRYTHLIARLFKKAPYICALLVSNLWSINAWSHDITAIVEKAKPSVVGIGLYDALGAQQHCEYYNSLPSPNCLKMN